MTLKQDKLKQIQEVTQFSLQIWLFHILYVTSAIATKIKRSVSRFVLNAEFMKRYSSVTIVLKSLLIT